MLQIEAGNLFRGLLMSHRKRHTRITKHHQLNDKREDVAGTPTQAARLLSA